MRRFRVSIAASLAAVALLAVTLAALLHPSPLWGSVFYSLTLTILTMAVLAAIFRRGAARAFSVGFCACGWAYFLAIFGPDPIANVGPNLITTAFLDIVYPFTIPKEVVGAGPISAPSGVTTWENRLTRTSTGGGKIILVGAFGGNPPATGPTPWELWTAADRTTGFNNATAPRSFRRVGHSFFCLIFATLGGVMARRFHEGQATDELGPNRGPAT